jgi:hypothetical protein
MIEQVTMKLVCAWPAEYKVGGTYRVGTKNVDAPRIAVAQSIPRIAGNGLAR